MLPLVGDSAFVPYASVLMIVTMHMDVDVSRAC